VETVITVHGVNTSGKWQKQIRDVLWPHFDCKPIKHRYYRWLGGTKLVLEPYALLLALVCYWLLLRWDVIPVKTSRFLIIALILGIGHAGSYLRRHLAWKSFRKDLSEILQKHPRPHLIAHSLGTYLSSRAHRQLPFAQFKRMIMVGCVLDPHLPWATMRTQDEKSFDAVRNEVAHKDWVVRVASYLDRLIPGFGGAGYSGFKGDSNCIHDVKLLNLRCPQCPTDGQLALIHNAICRHLGHSDAFIGPAHAALYWLPFLWGYEPGEFVTFLDLCQRAYDAFTAKSYTNVARLHKQLHQATWGGEGTLEHNVKIEIELRFPVGASTEVEPLKVDEVVRNVWILVARARKAVNDPPDTPGRKDALLRLRPTLAIDYAIELAFGKSLSLTNP
jgi:pimeloyl-ACP methyl ester carboxylesterase